MNLSLEQLKQMIPKSGLLKLAAFQTGGDGPSSTKIVYLNVGLVGIYGWLLMVVTFCGRYAWTGNADIYFAGAIGSVLIALVGFAANAQNAHNKATADASKTVMTSIKEDSPAPAPGGSRKTTDIVSTPTDGADDAK